MLQLVEDRRLWGRGLGWVDVHLLASVLLSDCGFWTLDKRLARAAAELGLSSYEKKAEMTLGSAGLTAGATVLLRRA